MRWIMLRPGEARTQIHLDKVDALPKQEKPALPLVAPDVPGMVERLKAHGSKIIDGPGPAPWDAGATYALFHDSEGNLILLSST
jgi:predicted enzyme related to lactoylglutathione lyase